MCKMHKVFDKYIRILTDIKVENSARDNTFLHFIFRIKQEETLSFGSKLFRLCSEHESIAANSRQHQTLFETDLSLWSQSCTIFDSIEWQTICKWHISVTLVPGFELISSCIFIRFVILTTRTAFYFEKYTSVASIKYLVGEWHPASFRLFRLIHFMSKFYIWIVLFSLNQFSKGMKIRHFLHSSSKMFLYSAPPNAHHFKIKE